jgi:hypothetical protein
MPTECSADLFGLAPVEGRKVVAAFDAGAFSRLCRLDPNRLDVHVLSPLPEFRRTFRQAKCGMTSEAKSSRVSTSFR